MLLILSESSMYVGKQIVAAAIQFGSVTSYVLWKLGQLHIYSLSTTAIFAVISDVVVREFSSGVVLI
jgi:hypothetical protein